MTTQYSNPWFQVEKEGSQHYVVEKHAHNGAVILVETPQSYLFVQLRRAAQGTKLLVESPRGYGESGETSSEAACRELYEETGYQVNEQDLTYLGKVMPNSAILTSSVDVYLARVTSNKKVKECDNEVEGLHVIDKSELKKKVRAGVIQDGFTLSALALLWSREG